MTRRLSTYRHPEGKRYCPVVVGPNGRIKPDWVMGNDRQEKHLEKRWIESPCAFLCFFSDGDQI